MKNTKLNQTIEISFNEAKKLIVGTIHEYDFDCLNESTISETVHFEIVQNRRYYITKIGKKGSVLYMGSDFEEKALEGVFELQMTWDYRHPSNFALNQNNLSKIWRILI